MREDNIHYAVRQFLKNSSWRLIAGQYPNGSDDELPPLNVVDPFLARDNSPDPRRHSKNKYVPDLVACKQEIMFIIEMKPLYSAKDEAKLQILLTERREHLVFAIEDMVKIRGVEITCPIQSIIFVPCLGFGASSRYPRNPRFCYFKVKDLSTVIFEGNSVVPNVSESF